MLIRCMTIKPSLFLSYLVLSMLDSKPLDKSLLLEIRLPRIRLDPTCWWRKYANKAVMAISVTERLI